MMIVGLEVDALLLLLEALNIFLITQMHLTGKLRIFEQY